MEEVEEVREEEEEEVVVEEEGLFKADEEKEEGLFKANAVNGGGGVERFLLTVYNK